MFANYLTTAFRVFLKNRLFSFINIVGLALGLIAVTLITLFVLDEMSYDKHVAGHEKIYRLEGYFALPGRPPLQSSYGTGRAKFGFLEEFPELETLTRLMPTNVPVRSGDNLYSEAVMYADGNVFEFFSMPFVSGDAGTALQDKSSVALSEDAARKFFGDAPAVGELLTITLRSGLADFRVSGVYKNIPQTSHLEMDMVVLLDDADFADDLNYSGRWVSANMYVYLQMKDAAQSASLLAKFPDFIDRNMTPEIQAFGMPFDSATEMAEWRLVALKDIHMHGGTSAPMKTPGSLTNLISFSVVAFLILIMAIMNFTNLTAANITKRVKEISLRKVMGATRLQIIVQIMAETLLTVSLAVLIALAAAQLLLPIYNGFLNKALSLAAFGPVAIIMIALLFTLAIAAVGGMYPAMLLTSYQPSDVLHSTASVSTAGNRHRSILVVVQFAASIMLLIATIVVYKQTSFMQGLDAGYRTEGVMVVHGLGSPETLPRAKSFKSSIANLQGVESTSLSGWVPADTFHGSSRAILPGVEEPVVMTMRRIDFDYFATYDIEARAGRLVDERFTGDLIRTLESDVRDGNVIINETAAQRIGFDSAQAAVGTTFQMLADDSDPTKTIQATVVGVIPDLLERSAREEVYPSVYIIDEQSFRKLSIHYNTSNLSALSAQVAETWKRFAPDIPLRMDFMADRVSGQYEGEEAAGQMFAVFSMLAIVISSLGLYGLASFAAESRTKEIGLRKIFGATTWFIVRLLTLQFSRGVIIANVIAWPVAWYFLKDWLGGFNYQVDLTFVPFLIAGVATMIMAWMTVGSHAYRVARARPIEALRHD